MNQIAHLQDGFVESLKSPFGPAPAFANAPSGTLERRFDVYRNNAFAGLIGVLETRFAAVSRILGEEFFRGFARQFIEQHPPQSPALLFYGSTFAGYIRAAAECADVPYLADVALIEWELHRCYHAADETILTVDDLAAGLSSPETMTFRLAASAAVVCSHHPAFSIWQANSRAQPPGSVRLHACAESSLISRKGLACEAVLLPPGGAEFAQSLSAGATLSDAALRAAEAAQDFRLDQVLGLMVRQNAFAATQLKDHRSER